MLDHNFIIFLFTLNVLYDYASLIKSLYMLDVLPQLIQGVLILREIVL